MSCCGRRINDGFGARPAARPASTGFAPAARGVTGFASPAAPAPILRLVYEYVGRGALTITSPATGRRYRFEHPGARQEVDRRDHALIAQQASLRQVI